MIFVWSSLPRPGTGLHLFSAKISGHREGQVLREAGFAEVAWLTCAPNEAPVWDLPQPLPHPPACPNQLELAPTVAPDFRINSQWRSEAARVDDLGE